MSKKSRRSCIERAKKKYGTHRKHRHMTQDPTRDAPARAGYPERQSTFASTQMLASTDSTDNDNNYEPATTSDPVETSDEPESSNMMVYGGIVLAVCVGAICYYYFVSKKAPSAKVYAGRRATDYAGGMRRRATAYAGGMRQQRAFPASTERFLQTAQPFNP